MNKMLDPEYAEYLPELMDDVMDFNRVYERKVSSVLVIDPNGWFPIAPKEDEGKVTLYVDFASCGPDCFERLARQIYSHIVDGRCMVDGLLLDNIDCIAADDADLQNLVAFALKKDDDYVAPGHSLAIPFSEIKVGARCREYPAFLDDYHLIAYYLVIGRP